jgi:AcrR family transcriptional regulator
MSGSEATAGTGGAVATSTELLLEAAADAIAESGYAGAGVQAIARRTGLTTGAIYANFSGKGELAAEAIERALRAQDLPIEELAGLNRAELWEFLLAQAGKAVSPDLARLRATVLEAHSAARHEPQIHGRVAQIQNERLEGITDFLIGMRESGRLRADVDPRAVAVLLFASTLGLALLDAADVALPAEDEWKQLVAVVMRHLTQVVASEQP